MGEVFGDQMFWKSRFIPSGDRGFLTSLFRAPSTSNGDQNDQQPNNRDWRSIYRCTAKIGVEDGHLFEFRRQWQHNRWIRERYTMTKDSEVTAYYNNMPNAWSWKSVSVDFKCDRFENQGTGIAVCHDCKMEHIPLEQAAPLGDTVVGIEVYILHELDRAFVTGFGLIEGGTVNQRLIFGYRVPGRYMVIDLDGRRLMGLHVAAARFGIRAVQPIFEDGLGRWAGDLNLHGTTCVEITSDTGVKGFLGQFDVSLPPLKCFTK